MIEMAVHEVGLRTADATPAIVLRERNGERLLSVRVSAVHANAVIRRSHRIPPFRPQTHEVFVAAMQALGAAIAGAYVESVDEQGGTAYLTVLRGPKTVTLNATAADAIVLAVCSRAPIYVAASLLGQSEESHPGADAPARIPEAAPATADPFRQFINSLNSLDELT